jgi:hypothetical protein
VLPGGRNFGQKGQKGPWKNKVGRKNLRPNFGRILPKVAEKGAEEYFLKKFLIERCSHTFRGKEKLKLHFELTLRVYVALMCL